MEEDEGNQNPPKKEESKSPQAGGGGGGWGGWGFSSFSVLSDLQKAAAAAAEEISRNAAAVAKSAAQSISDIQAAADSDSEAEKDEADATTVSAAAKEGVSAAAKEGDEVDSESESDKLRSSALDRLEKASEDSLLGQGLKVLDNSVESFASGAWLALGSAWKGGTTLVQKLEHSAANLADSIQHGGLPANSLAPSIIETGKSFTAKGIQVLERVGKETMEMIIAETGIVVEKNPETDDHQANEEQFEEVTFDRCFYIYGGPDQLEELEALSNHYALLFNRRKTKLLSEQKSYYDGKLKQIQQIFDMGSEAEENVVESDKGKNIEMEDDASSTEMKSLRDSSVSKAADMAAGFAAALGGLPANEIIQRTTGRLETVRSESVHRLSELCCLAVSHLLMLGKSVISNANKSKSEEIEDDNLKIEWPEDSILKAKIIRSKAQFMSGDVEVVSDSFVTGISDIIEAYQAALRSASSGGSDGPQQNSVQEKANTISNHLRADQTTALGKIQDALQYLAYVVLSTSMPTA